MLILASASPTRRQLLENAGLNFDTLPVDVDERSLAHSTQNDQPNGVSTALHLATAKAHAGSDRAPGALVIGADQTLIHMNQPLHKPVDMTAARRQLLQLRGQTHTLHAAAALVRDGKTLWSHVETARLTMRQFSEPDLQAVLAAEGKTLLGSVGAYRLEGSSIQLFEKIEGDYFTILGLPLLPLLEALRQHGFPT